MKIKVKIRDKKVIEVTIKTQYIKLDSFLKYCDAVSTGGIAKMIINDGLVKYNGKVCTSRGKKVYKGDFVEYENILYKVV